MNRKLTGWNHIVYTMIKNNFQNNHFILKDFYAFNDSFSTLYPDNFHIQISLDKHCNT